MQAGFDVVAEIWSAVRQCGGEGGRAEPCVVCGGGGDGEEDVLDVVGEVGEPEVAREVEGYMLGGNQFVGRARRGVRAGCTCAENDGEEED